MVRSSPHVGSAGASNFSMRVPEPGDRPSDLDPSMLGYIARPALNNPMDWDGKNIFRIVSEAPFIPFALSTVTKVGNTTGRTKGQAGFTMAKIQKVITSENKPDGSVDGFLRALFTP
jgi:hypothetical protein